MPPRPLLPSSQAVFGLTLFASIALPLTRGGESLLDIFLTMAARNPIGALIFLIMFAAPQLFGLAIAIARLLHNERDAVTLIQAPVVILQGMLVLLGLSLLNAPKLVAPVALLGFAAVTSGYFLYASAEASASSRQGLRLHWYIRWGALLVAGVGLWLRLQALGGFVVGIGIDVATVAASLLLVSTARRPRLPDR